MRSNRKNSVANSCNENISNSHPLVPWLRMVLKYLPGKVYLFVGFILHHLLTITSDFTKPPSKPPILPPIRVILPDTNDNLGCHNPCGRRARSVQLEPPGKRVTTLECIPDSLFSPPTTMKAWKGRVPNRMNFWKNSKRPSTPPSLRFGKYVAIF